MSLDHDHDIEHLDFKPVEQAPVAEPGVESTTAFAPEMSAPLGTPEPVARLGSMSTTTAEHSPHLSRRAVLGAAVGAGIVVAGGAILATRKHDTGSSTPKPSASNVASPTPSLSPEQQAKQELWQTEMARGAQQNADPANKALNALTDAQFDANFRISGKEVKTTDDLMKLSAQRYEWLCNIGGTLRKDAAVEIYTQIGNVHSGINIKDAAPLFAQAIVERYKPAIAEYAGNPTMQKLLETDLYNFALGHPYNYILAKVNAPDSVGLVEATTDLPMDVTTVTATRNGASFDLNPSDGALARISYRKTTSSSHIDMTDWSSQDDLSQNDQWVDDVTEEWRYDQAKDAWQLGDYTQKLISSTTGNGPSTQPSGAANS